ncbi:MAG: iron-sulfur cluster assembly scaffold protein [Candidatus Zixiibacteriota bacterium]
MSEREFSYNKTVMDHFRNPRNTGEIENPDAVAQTRNPACGDAILLTIKVSDERISEIKYLTFGCGAAIATCSMASKLAQNKSLSEAEQLSGEDIVDALGGLPERKRACAELAPNALKMAIAEYRQRNN